MFVRGADHVVVSVLETCTHLDFLSVKIDRADTGQVVPEKIRGSL